MSTMSSDLLAVLGDKYAGLFERLDEVVTPEAYFELFKSLSDNYSPTLTVSRVQGPLVEELMAGTDGLRVERNLRRSGSIGVIVGEEPAPIWLSAHADICSYLTGPGQNGVYELTPFCMHRARAGRRAAVALAPPTGEGSLERIAEGEMVTDDEHNVVFETDVTGLPPATRVVHHLPATWNRDTDEINGFIDNQGGSAAMLLAARALAPYDVNVTFLLNDEEEGPVNSGNQTFSRAATRLFNRTPLDMLPEMFVVTDGHKQGKRLEAGEPTDFGRGALFSGVVSGARGGVTPPQLLHFTRELATMLGDYGVSLRENAGYVSRSDDVSALQYTPNIAIIGYPGAYAHFDKTPMMYCNDLAHLSKVLAIYALVAQDPEWRAAYL